MDPETIWGSMPDTLRTTFTYHGHSDQAADYGEPVKMPPYNIYTSRAEYEWDNIRFISKREWFLAPRNAHLLVFRQTIEPMADCDFTIVNTMNSETLAAGWTVLDYLEQENNSCGLLLQGPDGRRTALCETSQIMSFSIRVQETRERVTRSIAVTAFEESPVKLEKYISRHTDEEEDYIERAFRECREASKIRFDDLRGRA